MKMNKQLWHILSLIILTFSGQAQVSFADLPLRSDDQWSFSGGVFQPATQAPVVSQPGAYTLLIMQPSGAVSSRLVQLNATAETNAVTNQSLLVDRNGPVITPTWQHVLPRNGMVKTGPDSTLQLQLSDGVIKSISMDGQSQQTTDGVVRFEPSVTAVSVVAADEFGNLSEWQQAVVPDFEAPSISWQLQPPALRLADQWYAGKTALVQLDVSGNNPLSATTLNGSTLASIKQPLTVHQGDVLQVTDVLGNRQQQTVQWVQDETAPEVSLAVGGVTYADTALVKLKVNELLSVSTVDHGVGLATQMYQSKSNRWQPLPKKFRFLNKGRYSIKIKGVDAVGNELLRTIQVKVRRK